MQLKREEKALVSPEYPIPTREQRETERKFVLVTQAWLCLFSFPLLLPNPQALLDG